MQTWNKQFHSSDKDKKIPLLYVANDILQNSRKNGKEFVEEFWKLLPAALKNVTEHGDDSVKTVVSRLVRLFYKHYYPKLFLFFLDKPIRNLLLITKGIVH